MKPAVQKIPSTRSNPPNLTQNVPFCTKTLNLLFLEKHKCRFAPLILSFPEQHLWAPWGDKCEDSHMSLVKIM